MAGRRAVTPFVRVAIGKRWSWKIGHGHWKHFTAVLSRPCKSSIHRTPPSQRPDAETLQLGHVVRKCLLTVMQLRTRLTRRIKRRNKWHESMLTAFASPDICIQQPRDVLCYLWNVLPLILNLAINLAMDIKPNSNQSLIPVYIYFLNSLLWKGHRSFQ